MEITACDFDLAQKVLAIGLKDGGVKLLDIEKLAIKEVFLYESTLQQTYPSVTSVNCRLSGRVVAGYENGVVKEFSVINQTAISIFTPPDKEPGIPIHIECIEKDNIIIVAYHSKGTTKIYSYKSGAPTSIVSTITHSGEILAIHSLEWAKVLVTLSKASNEVSVYNYLDGELLLCLHVNIPGLTDHNPLTTFSLLQVTRQMRQVYVGDSETSSLDQPEDSLQGPKGDIIVFGLENGTVLTAYLVLRADKGKIMGTLIPQQIYKTQTKGEASTGIKALFVDPVTDRLLAGDGEGNIVVFEKIVLRVLNPAKAQKYEEEKKAKTGGWMHKIGLGGWTVLDEIHSNYPASSPAAPVISESPKKVGGEVEMVEKKGSPESDKKVEEEKNQ